MFAQSESEELLHLLSQVRLVADEEERNEQEQHQHEKLEQRHRPSIDGDHTIPVHTSAAGTTAGVLDKRISNGSSASIASGAGGSAAGRYTASSTAAVTSSWTVHDNTDSTFGINTAAASNSFLADYEHRRANPFDQPPVSRTPATDVKVLLQPSDERARCIEVDLADQGDGYNIFQQPKQLLFAFPSAAAQILTGQQQQRRCLEQLQQQRSLPLVTHARQSMPSPHAYNVYTASVSTAARTTTPHSIDDAAPILPVAVEREGSGYPGAAADSAILRDTPSPAVTSSVPSAYTKRDDKAVAEGVLEGISHIAAVMQNDGFDRDCEEEFGRTSGGGGGGDRLSDVWTPARSIGTPQSALDGSNRSLRLFHLQQQQQQQSHQHLHQHHTTPSSPSSAAEAAVAQFFRVSSSADVMDNGGLDSAWRANVEAELAELQRGGRLSVNGAVVQGTPISTVSPLPPTSTTPYHQLLSQLRQSPSQVPASGLGPANAAFTGRTAHANTPPEQRPLTSSSRLASMGPTPLYTAHITSIPRASSAAAAAGASTEQGRSSWPRSSLTPSEAAALWERLSPYERAAAAAAAASSNAVSVAAAAALLHTPDTVSKPVTLSSIAAHLHSGVGDLGSSDEMGGAHAHAGHPSRTYASPPTFTTAPMRVPRPASAAQLFPPSSPSQPNSTSPATAGTDVSPHHGWQQSHSNHRQGQYSQTASPRTSATTVMALPPPPPASTPSLATAAAAAAGPYKSQQNHLQTPSMRRWSPVDAPPSTTGAGPVAGNAHNTNSPPSCSMRPSPHPRPSNGSSPALRRYTITTPSSNATTATAANNNNTNSGGKKRVDGSRLGVSGASVADRGASREARPRVQLSQTSCSTGVGAAVCGGARGARGSLSASAHGAGSGASPSSPSYHYNHSNHAGHHLNSPSNSAGATTGTGASMVSAAAVQALIQRLQAAAAIVLPNSPSASSAVTGGGQMSFTAEESSVVSVTAVPDVVSASIILAMSHDQHGCRLLQAVIDAECNESEALDGGHGELAADDAAAAVSPSMTAGASAGEKKGSVSERRRRRRAEAFENSIPVRVVLRAIEPKLDAVMADGYGNFLLQKVFDMAPDAERQRLLRLPSLQHHLCEVACSPHGTFAVQRLVETVRNTEEERLVFVALERDLLRLLTNANGGHVLMKVMECIRRQYNALASGASSAAEPSSASMAAPGESSTAPSRRLLEERVATLFQAIQQHLLYVCQHKQGCCIVQKCLDFLHACAGLSPSSPSSSGAMEQMDYFERMAALLLPHVQELSTHPFGNYVVTRLVDVCYARGSTATIDAVAAGMQRDLVQMCTNKFASNVIEHILRHCSERRIRLICQSLMVPLPHPSAPAVYASASTAAATNAAIARLPLTTVVMDPYGNYVIQTLLTVAPVDELVSTRAEGGGMLSVLQQLLPLLSSRNYGRKLETKTELALLRVEQQQQQQKQRRS
ncbi:putative pumillio protein 4 [Leishmania major strain Friedlin]|uniref:Putative pumillio protein 4 n=1 Tax=Leishmania major TaxID=5664 RepID=Q4QGQ5_LEIMA|nr:putative pumillio protein 4 [Leishmania major strain Friedlin]CAG9570444.1 pumilio_protein_4/PUF4 [Leishmania major strain Friedlin]CAJ02549.1 putative pumillio protein 4 [Leishmania major strain Friedlin]|eukprot:XP_001681643.1 putative pumillio protein 4 [Leishmania major strain Friedlin]